MQYMNKQYECHNAFPSLKCVPEPFSQEKALLFIIFVYCPHMLPLFIIFVYYLRLLSSFIIFVYYLRLLSSFIIFIYYYNTMLANCNMLHREVCGGSHEAPLSSQLLCPVRLPI